VRRIQVFLDLYRMKLRNAPREKKNPLRAHAKASSGDNFSSFTPLENPAIYGGDDMDKISTPYRKGGVKTPILSNGVNLQKDIRSTN